MSLFVLVGGASSILASDHTCPLVLDPADEVLRKEALAYYHDALRSGEMKESEIDEVVITMKYAAVVLGDFSKNSSSTTETLFQGCDNGLLVAALKRLHQLSAQSRLSATNRHLSGKLFANEQQSQDEQIERNNFIYEELIGGGLMLGFLEAEVIRRELTTRENLLSFLFGSP